MKPVHNAIECATSTGTQTSANAVSCPIILGGEKMAMRPTPIARAISWCVRHRLMCAVLPGGLVPVLGLFLSPWNSLGKAWPLWSGFLYVVYVGGVSLCAWPLRSFRLVFHASLVASFVFASIGFVNLVMTAPGPFRSRFGTSLLTSSMVLGAIALSSSALLCIVVAIRRRFWPVRLAGICQHCGYDLFGLSSNRCPECGVPFTQAMNDVV